MAGVGKSAIGNSLAKALGCKFIDTDKLIEEERGKALQNILDELGDEGFIRLESSKIKEFSKTKHAVFAPGGSVIYSQDAMKLLKNISNVVYIFLDPQTIEKRINIKSRGIVGLRDKSFQELFAERETLYKYFADLTIDTSGKTPSEIGKEILSFTAP